jgi:Lon protease-like protein
MLYEKLNAEMKSMVDRYAERLRIFDWGRRSDLLSETAMPFGEDLPPDKAKVAAQGFVTAILERLGESEVTDPRQAELYLLSLNPAHRAEAERYLAENPEA